MSCTLLIKVFMQLSWKCFLHVCACRWCWGPSCLPGSWWTFGMSHADTVQRPAGHLLSIRGRWGMEWDNPSTGDSAARLGVQMCWQQWPNVTSTNELLSLSPTDKTPDHNRKDCSVSVRYIWSNIYRYLSLVESLAQLSCGCYSDLIHTQQMWLCLRHQLVSANPMQNLKLALASARQVNSCLKSAFVKPNQRPLTARPL